MLSAPGWRWTSEDARAADREVVAEVEGLADALSRGDRDPS
jgi:hypothetical protein